MEEEVYEECTLIRDYLTAGEEDALSTLRKLKEESHKIRDKIRKIEEALALAPQHQSPSAFHKTREGLHRELGGCFQQLEKLRGVWKEWETRREVANKRKTVLLGYSP